MSIVKKLVAIVMIAVVVLSVATVASASGRTAYTQEKDQFIVVAYDAEKQEVYTGVYTLATVARLARENAMCECYLFESDALVSLSWTVENGVVVFTSDITGEVVAAK